MSVKRWLPAETQEKKKSKALDMNIVLQLVLSEKWRGSEFSDAVGKQRISFPVTSAVCWY